MAWCQPFGHNGWIATKFVFPNDHASISGLMVQVYFDARIFAAVPVCAEHFQHNTVQDMNKIWNKSGHHETAVVTPSTRKTHTHIKVILDFLLQPVRPRAHTGFSLIWTRAARSSRS